MKIITPKVKTDEDYVEYMKKNKPFIYVIKSAEVAIDNIVPIVTFSMFDSLKYVKISKAFREQITERLDVIYKYFENSFIPKYIGESIKMRAIVMGREDFQRKYQQALIKYEAQNLTTLGEVYLAFLGMSDNFSANSIVGKYLDKL